MRDRQVVKKEVYMVDFKNYTADQMSAALDVLEQVGRADEPLLECVKLSVGLMKELSNRIDDMEVERHG